MSPVYPLQARANMYYNDNGGVLEDRTNVYDDDSITSSDSWGKTGKEQPQADERVARIVRIRAHAATYPARIAEASQEAERYQHFKLFDWVPAVRWQSQVHADDGTISPLSATEGYGKQYRMRGRTSRRSEALDRQHIANSPPVITSVPVSQPLSTTEVISLLEMLGPTLSRLRSSTDMAPVNKQYLSYLVFLSESELKCGVRDFIYAARARFEVLCLQSRHERERGGSEDELVKRVIEHFR
ncbi:hypothetical protein EDD85DRAFT_793338 [Armillaria nabsnona]|nr:hypothetical protein EDD85DRAFT_793338 [Armillaria nabsnona]